MAGTSDEERSGPRKERETKDDGRYIIFYEFDDETSEDEPSSEGKGEAS